MAEFETPIIFTDRNPRALTGRIRRNFPTSGSSALKPDFEERADLSIVPSFSPKDNVAALDDFRSRKEEEKSQAAESKLSTEIEHALTLKTAFHRALDISPESQPKKPLSFEPWTERAKFEREILSSSHSGIEKQSLAENFKHETTIQMETNLKERYQSETSIMLYSFHGDKLRSDYFPTEDFELILRRGQEWRLQNGSNDLEREKNEIDGFLKIQQILNPDAKIGTKVISLSPQSLAENSPYQKKFVDIFELKENPDGSRSVHNTRFAVDMDHEGYAEKAIKLDPDYFNTRNEANSAPLDAYFLANPIPLPDEVNSLTPKEIFDTLFESDQKSRKEELILQALQAGTPFIRQFVEEICKSEVDWKQVALTFNATLNFVDKYLEDLETPIASPSSAILFNKSDTSANISLINISVQIDHWGRKEVRQIAAGCGASGGFSMGSGSGIGASISLENSVASFGAKLGGGIGSEESDEYGSLEFSCPNCKQTIKRPKGELVSSCGSCKANVAC